MGNITALKAEFTKKTIEGRIKGLAAKLYKLSPHPENPAHRGPLFISLNSAFKPAADYDGMLGNMMLESFLGTAFSEASNDNSVVAALSVIPQSNLDDLADAASEYIEYRADKSRGKGTFALGEHKTICNHFNTEELQGMDAYSSDLRERTQTEEAISDLYRTLQVMKGQNEDPTLKLYA